MLKLCSKTNLRDLTMFSILHNLDFILFRLYKSTNNPKPILIFCFTFCRAEKRDYYNRQAVSVHQPDDLLSVIYDGMHKEKTKLPRYSKNSAKDLESIQRIPCSFLGLICHWQGTKCIYRISEIKNKGNYCLHFSYSFCWKSSSLQILSLQAHSFSFWRAVLEPVDLCSDPHKHESKAQYKIYFCMRRILIHPYVKSIFDFSLEQLETSFGQC